MISHRDNHYRAIQEYYGDRVAERSRVPLINHINEGLVLLTELQASIRAHQAFCLHPLVLLHPESGTIVTNEILENYDLDSEAQTLVREFRIVVDGYKSRRKIASLLDIQLSDNSDVQTMIIADKVQNRKDFEIYHKETHPRSTDLQVYFRNWLTRLGISEERYQELADCIRG